MRKVEIHLKTGWHYSGNIISENEEELMLRDIKGYTLTIYKDSISHILEK